MTMPKSDYSRGDVWWVEFAPSRGSETQKTRPAVILNLDSMGVLPLRIVAPLTTWREKFEGKAWLISIPKSSSNGLLNDSAADVFQIRSASTERFRERLGHLSREQVDDIVAALGLCLGYSPT